MALPAPDVTSFTLRMRKSLHRRLEREAQRHRFTLNNEIRIRLEDSLTRDDRRVLEDIANDMQINWARFSGRFLLLSLEDDLAAALAKTKDPEVAKLARVWLHTRAVDRRLTEGGVS
jgi:hypothetical protein